MFCKAGRAGLCPSEPGSPGPPEFWGLWGFWGPGFHRNGGGARGNGEQAVDKAAGIARDKATVKRMEKLVKIDTVSLTFLYLLSKHWLAPSRSGQGQARQAQKQGAGWQAKSRTKSAAWVP